jgi:hypothetical protein
MISRNGKTSFEENAAWNYCIQYTLKKPLSSTKIELFDCSCSAKMPSEKGSFFCRNGDGEYIDAGLLDELEDILLIQANLGKTIAIGWR